MWGTELGEDGTIALKGPKACCICLPPLDGIKGGAGWGRLQIQAELPQGSILSVYASAADNQDEITKLLLEKNSQGPVGSGEHRIAYFEEHGIGPFTNQKNILLYGLTGRFLWIALKISRGDGGRITGIRVLDPGDNFMQTFPEVYQERNSVFHRYLSVFSTIYNDFQEGIEEAGKLFQIQSAPEWMLPQIGSLFGINTGDKILPAPTLKKLLENAYRYVHMKGTKRVMQELAQLLIGEVPLIIEKEDENVTFLLNRKLDEEEEMWALFFLNQFKPVYSRLNLISFEEEVGLDRYCFVDANAKLHYLEGGYLDQDAASEQCMME